MDHQKEFPERTLLMMECGYLDLSAYMPKGMLLLGKTKAGKTTSSHFMTHQILESAYNDQKELVFKLKNTNKAVYMNAKIGDNPIFSETQIPNIFDFTSERDGKVFIVDCPGYVDSYGCLRITSNRFFHYQVFSRVEQIKFVITFTFADMRMRADNMRTTFKEFLKGFNGLTDIKDNIIKATAVLVTGVPSEFDREALLKNYEKTPDIGGENNEFYKQLKKSLVKDKRVFLFHSPTKLGECCNVQNSVLDEISAVTTFWKRSVDTTKNQVDMANININLMSYVDQDGEQEFFDELEELCSFYRNIVIEDFKNMATVVNFFVADCENEGSMEFVKQVRKLIDKKTAWREANSKCKDLYKRYEEKRNKMKQEMLQPTPLFASESASNSADIPLWISKLKTLMKINEIAKVSLITDGSDDEDCVRLSKNIKQILSYLHTLVKAKDSDPNPAEKKKNEAVMLDYCYEMIKNLEISNKLSRLMSGKKKAESKNQANAKGLKFILEEYPTSLKNFLLKAIGKLSAAEILCRNLGKFTISESLSQGASEQISRFFTEIKTVCLGDSELEMTPEEKGNMSRTIDLMVVKLDNKKFEALKEVANPSLKNLIEMEEKRKAIVNKITEANKMAQPSEQMQLENNRTIQLMAKCLHKNERVEEALELYDLLFDGFKVLQLLEAIEVKQKKWSDKDKLDFLIRYAEKAHKYQRRELALAKASEAFHLAQEAANFRKTIETTKLLKSVSCQQSDSSYLQFLNKEVTFVEIPQPLCDKIQKLAIEAKK